MVINFTTREISQGTCKLTRTPTLKKKKYIYIGQNYTLAKLVISKKINNKVEALGSSYIVIGLS
jgi:hypothetical protein